MLTVKLFCLIVGVKKSGDQDDDSKHHQVDANKLQLFLAKNDRAWLQSCSEDVKKLKKGDKTAAIQVLTQEDKELQGEIGLAAVLADMDDPLTDQIHVLVVVPEQDQLEKIDAENEEAFWSEDIQIQADSTTNEAAFDAFVTPYFSQILRSCGMVFVNSEKYEWLTPSSRVTNRDLKPVGFATHCGMYRAKPEPDDGVHAPVDFALEYQRRNCTTASFYSNANA
ncbi:hypothetical protein V7S43_012006 [Phytophthora oleae]|uniref:Uncharacterized protein n=1 Tax=Phytophthora oleae TaxID=2107226 RepID=A0ABD3F9C7_9STRA